MKPTLLILLALLLAACSGATNPDDGTVRIGERFTPHFKFDSECISQGDTVVILDASMLFNYKPFERIRTYVVTPGYTTCEGDEALILWNDILSGVKSQTFAIAYGGKGWYDSTSVSRFHTLMNERCITLPCPKPRTENGVIKRWE